MKRLLFITAMLISFSYLPAQTNILQKEKDNITNDIVLLQKSNAALKVQLNDQKQILLKEIEKTDSIFSLLQSINSEIQKSAVSQNSIASSMTKLEDQTSKMSMSLHKRKYYVIFGLVSSFIFVLVYLLYMRSKLSTLKIEMNQKETDLNNKILKTEEYINAGIDEIKVMFSEQQNEMNQIYEKQRTESNQKLAQLSSDTNESITKIGNELNKTMENERKSVKEIIHEHRDQSEKEFDQKIAEINKSIQAKLDILQKEIDRKNSNPEI